MSQPPGRKSDKHHQHHHRADRSNMAVTYSSNYSSAPGQTLPPFRELLPQHLHEEIDRPLYAHSQPRADRVRTPDNAYKPRSSLPLPHPSAAPSFSSRGPSPILPPFREISARHHHDHPVSAYDDASTRGSRGGSSGGRGRESSYDSPRTGATTSSRAQQSYTATTPSAAALYGNQNAYDPAWYPPAASGQYPPYPPNSSGGSTTSSNEYDYSVSPMTTHSHTLPPGSSPSNFGVMGGDPLDSRGKKRRGNLPKPVTDVLRAWFHDHLDHPYPTEEDKQIFMNQTGLSISQISNWFINARRRQLPALRNQLRNSDGEQHMIPRGVSPISDGDASMSPPHIHSTSSPTRMRHR